MMVAIFRINILEYLFNRRFQSCPVKAIEVPLICMSLYSVTKSTILRLVCYSPKNNTPYWYANEFTVRNDALSYTDGGCCDNPDSNYMCAGD